MIKGPPGLLLGHHPLSRETHASTSVPDVSGSASGANQEVKHLQCKSHLRAHFGVIPEFLTSQSEPSNMERKEARENVLPHRPLAPQGGTWQL